MKKWFRIFIPLLLLLGMTALTETVGAKELTNVVTDVIVWDVTNGREATKKDGVYQLIQNNAYRYAVDFDLSAYDGNLSDGDTFTFTIPDPMTVSATSFDLIDKETNMAVGEAMVTSNGAGAGGTATITLKNLAEYLKAKGGTQVQGVAGTFYTQFKIEELTDSATISFDVAETTNAITHEIKVSASGGADYSDIVGKENYAKTGGVMYPKNWTSETLGKSGEYVHGWTVRINTRQASYDTIEVTDTVSEDYSPMQIIPETVKVTAGWYDNNLTMHDQEALELGTHYTIEWNASYTQFVLKISNASSYIKNGKPASFRLTYDTSSPADGTNVQNIISMKGDDQVITNATTSRDTFYWVTRNTIITQGGTIQLQTGYRITLYKVDGETMNRLPGAQFKITPPAGATASEEIVTTDQDGVAQSSIYSAADVALGTFTITEVKAPLSYILDSTPIEVTVNESGVIRTVRNTKYKTTAQLSAHKELTGRGLAAGEFEFVLTDQDGKEVERVTNNADGSITFNELTFDTAGTYTYTITETAGGLGGVTYDNSTVTATVEVTVVDAATGELTATVSYANDVSTFSNSYTPAPASAEVKVTKALTGRTLDEDEFEFVLAKEDGTEVETVKNAADGSVTFSALSFDKAGTYTYTIKEKSGNLPGITYDTATITVIITVTDDGSGELAATVAYSEDTEFNNVYEEPTTITTTAATTTTEATTTAAATTTTEATTTAAATTTTEAIITTAATTTTESTTTAAAITTTEVTTTTVPPVIAMVTTTTIEEPVTTTTSNVSGPITTETPRGGKKVLPSTGADRGIMGIFVGFALTATVVTAGALHRKSQKF